MIKSLNFLSKYRQNLIQAAVIILSLVALVYFVYSGRQSTLEMLVMLVILSLGLKFIGPVGLLSLLGVLIWSSKSVPGVIQQLTGPLLTNAYLIEFLIIAWLGFLISYQALQAPHGGKRLVLPPYWPMLVVFLLGWVIAFLSGPSPDQSYAWRMLLQAGITPVALYILVAQYVKTSRDGQRVLYGLILGGLILAAFQLTRFRYVAPPYEIQAQVDTDRLTGNFDLGPVGIATISLNNTALYFGMLFALVYSLAINLKSLRLWLPVFGVAAVLGWVIIQMGTRSVWISLPFAVLVVSYLSLRANPNAYHRLFLFWISMAIGIMLLLSIKNVSSWVSEDVANRMQTLSSVETLSTDQNWLGRVEQWRSGIALLSKYPLGTGYITGLPPLYTSMHSEYMALVLASGIPGLFAVLVFLGLAARRLFREIGHLEQGAPHFWIFPGVLGNLVVFIISVVATDPSKRFYPYLVFWLILSVGMAVAQNNRRRSDFSK